MKIMILNDMLWGGGRERRIVQLISGLNSIGVLDIWLVLFDEKIDYPEVKKLKVNIVFIKKKSALDFSIFNALFRLIKSVNPDVINPWSFLTTFYAVPIARILKKSTITSFIVDCRRPKLFSRDWVSLMIGFSLCDFIVSNSIAGHLAYRTPKEKQIVINNGFDFKRLEFTKDYSKSDVLTICMIGRLDNQKDFMTFLKSLKVLEDRNLKFRALVVGQGPDLNNLKSYVKNNISSEVIFAGFVKNIDSLISSIDIGVLATNVNNHSEGISNAILEMMAHGKPVVATNAGGTPEIVLDGRTGILVPHGNHIVIADALAMLINDPDMRAEMGANSHAVVREKFDLSHMSLKFMELYSAVFQKN